MTSCDFSKKGALKSPFLFQVPKTSAETEVLGPFFLVCWMTSGRSSMYSSSSEGMDSFSEASSSS
jgi:hypothetical protein